MPRAINTGHRTLHDTKGKTKTRPCIIKLLPRYLVTPYSTRLKAPLRLEFGLPNLGLGKLAEVEAIFQEVDGRHEEVLSSFRSYEIIGRIDRCRSAAIRDEELDCLGVFTLPNGDVETRLANFRKVCLVRPRLLDEAVAPLNRRLIAGEQETAVFVWTSIHKVPTIRYAATHDAT